MDFSSLEQSDLDPLVDGVEECRFYINAAEGQIVFIRASTGLRSSGADRDNEPAKGRDQMGNLDIKLKVERAGLSCPLADPAATQASEVASASSSRSRDGPGLGQDFDAWSGRPANAMVEQESTGGKFRLVLRRQVGTAVGRRNGARAQLRREGSTKWTDGCRCRQAQEARHHRLQRRAREDLGDLDWPRPPARWRLSDRLSSLSGSPDIR